MYFAIWVEFGELERLKCFYGFKKVLKMDLVCSAFLLFVTVLSLFIFLFLKSEER